ncbi:MAG TPA: hydantoinase/oxoprolinase family protein [Candidatus Binatia bacterium]|nr:hydantoinase/oxoprolinase family protein [Candidatus Binatia bacterium]
MGYRIGADIGGTFTDLILVDDAGGTFQVGKVLTTPERPDDGVLAGLGLTLEAAGVPAAAVAHVIHGTTLFTNALIERRGPRTALVTTRGFRDVIEIAREHRYDIYDLHLRRPRPLAPRSLRFEVDERVLADGTVRTPLDRAAIDRVLADLRVHAVEAVAVCLIHSYAHDAHERQLGDAIRRALPHVAVTLSCEVVRELREYERSSTTLANVYCQSQAEAYLHRLGAGLRRAGVPGELYVMQSTGGLCEVETAARYPVRLIESGPAGGALAAAHYGRVCGHADLLSFDMGGTTAKACIIAGGEPLIAPEFEVDRQYQFKKGSGLPIKVPVIEMIEIGTGGGSVARVDALRRLVVGPESAGASPGPASYGRGGTEPTVTDADLVLGYLDPDFFLGGQMPLDVAAARSAIEARVGRPLGLGVEEAAWAIHQLANESMAGAARIHAVERGKDVGALPLFAFGGAGPVHAHGVARILRSPSVICPRGAGVMSTVGFLVAPMAFDFVRTLPGELDDLDWPAVARALEEMEDEGRAILGRAVPGHEVTFRRSADMRYRKQGYEIRVPLPAGRLDASRRDEVRRSFEDAYRALYGHTVAAAPIDAVSWRVVATGPRPQLTLPRAVSAPDASAAAARKGARLAWAPERRRLEPVPVYNRYALAAGTAIEGPAIVEERESTVVLGAGARTHSDEWGTLIVDLRP